MPINPNSLKNLIKGHQKGGASPFWNGDKAVYSTIHKWLVREFGNPKSCEDCGKEGSFNKAGQWMIEWANISKEYKRDRLDYKGLCISCHIKFDKGIKQYNCGTNPKYKEGCRCDKCRLAKSLYRKGKIAFLDEIPNATHKNIY